MALSINLWISIVKFSIKKTAEQVKAEMRGFLPTQSWRVKWIPLQDTVTQAMEPLSSGPHNIWPCVSANPWVATGSSPVSSPLGAGHQKAGTVQGSCKESSCWTPLAALPIPRVGFMTPPLAESKHSETFWRHYQFKGLLLFLKTVLLIKTPL